MDKMNRTYVIVTGLLLLFLLSACGGVGQKYGKNLAASLGPNPMTIETLIENWQDYDLYYSGLGETQAYAVVFDPKDDDRTLDCSSWTKIEGKQKLTFVIERMKTFMKGEQKLFKILGPDGQLYGYVYTPTDGTTTKLTAPNTLNVYPIGVGG